MCVLVKGEVGNFCKFHFFSEQYNRLIMSLIWAGDKDAERNLHVWQCSEEGQRGSEGEPLSFDSAVGTVLGL